MIVVTGATGKLGRLIVEELASRVPSSEIGVSVREPEKASEFRERGFRVRKGDFAQPSTLRDAFEGASQILMVSSNAGATGGDTLGQHRAAISAAKEAGVQRLVYTSQIASSHSSAFPPARNHAATEDTLAESGVAWTALRNGFYAESALMYMGRDWQKGKIVAPADGKISWTTHADLAAAAAAILVGVRIFDGPTPPLTGSEALDLTDLASVASSLIHRPVHRETMSDESFAEVAKERGMHESLIQVALGYYEASKRGEFSTVDPTLEQLIGRSPQRMRDVLAAVVAESH